MALKDELFARLNRDTREVENLEVCSFRTRQLRMELFELPITPIWALRARQYDMTAHATEELAEDDLNIVDVAAKCEKGLDSLETLYS